MVPSCASTKRPRRLVAAPVKAPRAWPKSSLSRRCSGNAAQLTATNERSARGPLVWMDSATSSLPVPVSPEISTDDVASATCAMSDRSCRMARLFPINLRSERFVRSVRRKSAFSLVSARSRQARSTSARSVSSANGLVT